MFLQSTISIALLVWLRETRDLRVYIEKRSRDNYELKQIATASDNSFLSWPRRSGVSTLTQPAKQGRLLSARGGGISTFLLFPYFSPSSETQGQIVGARERLNGGEWREEK